MIYGKNTNVKDKNGKSLYEFDRVYMKNSKDQIEIGTILNTADCYHPEYKILKDQKYWENRYVKEFVDLNHTGAVLIEEKDPNSNPFKTDEEFDNYCKKYDYRSLMN